MRSLIKQTTLGLTALLACSFTLQGAPESINAAYRKDADIAGYFDLAAMNESPLNKTLNDQVSDPTWEAIRESLNVEDGDLKEFAFSASELDSEEEGAGKFSAIMRVAKAVTLDQIESVIKEQNEANAASGETVKYERRDIDGVPALVFQDETSGEDTLALSSFVKGSETLLVLATPTALGDVANNRNAGQIPEFAKNASTKLTQPGQGYATLKLTDTMKSGIKEALEAMANPESNPMGFPMPQELVQNLHTLDFVTLGVSMTDAALFELQGIFPGNSQASAVSTGMAGLLPMVQMFAGFAFAGLNEDGTPPPFTPSFAQGAKDNTASFKMTLTPAAQQ